ncbi:hypothetical protein [Priestia aryabhattai]|uniref:hypothetical protein n=1 Tax=Priestia aryabhattai TaxID=412384 RepID=UPI001C8F16E1|nr:hypothetical protein [Priestia aryabhattai]MBX9988380.1 hypothetical protein [Priestia aryabhattai]
MITINKDKYYILTSKNGKCYVLKYKDGKYYWKPLTSTKSKCKKHKKTCLKKKKCTKCQQKCLKKCLRKCKKKSLRDYHTIKIPVPKPAGISGLPEYICFQIEDSFTDQQEQRIKDGIFAVLAVWKKHHDQKWNGGTNNGTSDLAACTNIYARKNLKPAWYRRQDIPNVKTVTNMAMDQFTQLIKDNGLKKYCPAKIKAEEIGDIEVGTIRSLSTSKRFKVPLSIGVNPKQLDNPRLNISMLAGSLFHAWLHRAGWDDPKTTAYFISECPMCIMRGYQSKNPAVPDSTYTKFFD